MLIRRARRLLACRLALLSEGGLGLLECSAPVFCVAYAEAALGSFPGNVERRIA